jgi:tRNA threonylcarbamoyladenosine modification (KEOPS) complex  Pcc1 subunit
MTTTDPAGRRRAEATITTTHDAAALVANALAPDNTTEMTTTVDDDRVVTRIERETASGLQSTVDDYVVNLAVATEIVQHTDHESPQPRTRTQQQHSDT